MSYLVLARKYRPRTFEEVCGQEVVTRTLTGAITDERVAHAYLLSGPRGTGKTTIARILAKALNCEEGPTATPCGTCDRCVDADRGADADVIEIDAASNNGVDEVRALREQAAYSPMRGRYKVYLIDEVHMLSKAAFNALLKTLEEPPPHVKFLFATTERNRVPDTILSRCQVLQLDPLPEPVISAHLDEVFKAEEIKAAEGVADGIARMARGGMRDALSIADRLISLSGKDLGLEDFERLSSTRGGDALALLEHTLAGDGPALLEALPKVEGSEVELTDELLNCARGCLLLAHCGEGTPLVEAKEETRGRMAALGTSLGPARAEVWLEELLLCRERIHTLTAHGRSILESTLLMLARGSDTLPLGDLVARMTALEAGLRAGAGLAESAPVVNPAPAQAAALPLSVSSEPEEKPKGRAKAAEPEVKVLSPKAPPEPEEASSPGRKRTEADRRAARSSSAEAWSAFLEDLSLSARGLGDVIRRKGRLVTLESERAVVRTTDLLDEERALLGDARNRRTLSKVLSSVLGRDVSIELEDADEIRPGADDEYTKRVADLFDGHIED
jgi:DNA polymerase III subunit gamma/tau